jgi:IS30 family transposase
VCYKKGMSITEIAEEVKRDKSTISRELRRNQSRDEGYNATGAQRKYNKRRKRCVRTTRLLAEENLRKAVGERLDVYWSPEQISYSLPEGMSLSFSTIYRGIKKKLFTEQHRKKLRRYGKQLKRRKSARSCYDFSQVRQISERPAEALDRAEFGHWELDTIVLRKECGCHLATFVERKSRYTIIRRIENKKAKAMSALIVDVLSVFPPSFVKTITVDRGLEFTDWHPIELALDAKVYFCDPYSPWQRGSNENTNGLIRQFFPRRHILPPVSELFVSLVQSLLNNRPRKCLNWLSPFLAFCCT